MTSCPATNTACEVLFAQPGSSTFVSRSLGYCEHVSFGYLDGTQLHKAHCVCRDHSVPDGLAYVAAYNAAMLPSSDIQEVFKAVIKERRPPKFSKL